MKLNTSTIFLGVIILVAVVFAIELAISFKEGQYKYIKGQFGHICYQKGSENKNIRHPAYFYNLDDCVNSLPAKTAPASTSLQE